MQTHTAAGRSRDSPLRPPQAPGDFEPQRPQVPICKAGACISRRPRCTTARLVGYVHITAPLDAAYPDWTSFLLITAAGHCRRGVHSVLARRAAAAADLGPDRESGANHEARLAGEDYSLRVERSSQDEIGSLIDGFNEMLGPDQAPRLAAGTLPAIPRTAGRGAYREPRQRQPRSCKQAIAEATRAKGGGGAGEQREKRVPGPHEPRDPHPDERRHGHVRTAAGHRALGAAAASRGDHHALRRGASARSSTTSWTSRRSRPESSSWSESSSALRETIEETIEILDRARPVEGSRAALRSRFRRCRRSSVAIRCACGRCSSIWWATPSSSPRAARVIVRVRLLDRRRTAALRGDRHRHRHHGGGPAAHLQRLQSGRLLHHPQVRRHRPRPGNLPAARHADGR